MLVAVSRSRYAVKMRSRSAQHLAVRPACERRSQRVRCGVAAIALAHAGCIAGCGGSTAGPEPLSRVTTRAGMSGACDFADATAGAARFNLPSGVAVSRAGDIYVADFQNFRVRRVSAAGEVTTFAGGDTTAGRVIDATGGAAGFAYPSALAIDGADNLVVYDRCAVRRIDPAGRVTTLAGGAMDDGTPLCGNSDATIGAQARFDDGGYGGGIAIDARGTVYVADFGNAAVRRVDASGAVTTLAGGMGAGYRDAAGGEAKLDGPAGIAVLSDGTLVVADLNNNRIRSVSATGAVGTVAGSGESRSLDGVGAAAALYRPWGVAVAPSGDLLVTENRGNRIRRITPSGEVTTFAGTGFSGSKDAPLLEASFYAPGQLAFAPDGELAIVDQASCVLRVLTP